MEVRLAKYTFTPTGEKTWRAWAQELKQRSEEVLETLRNEGIRCEACFIDDATHTLFYFIEVKDLKKARVAYHNSKLPIDQDHKHKRTESLEKSGDLKTLFYFGTE